MTRVVVDADYLVYSTGFAVEKTKYDVSGTYAGREYEAGPFDSKDDAEAWCLDMESCNISKLVEPEPLAHALYLVNKTLAGITRALKPDKTVLYITGSGNFRDQLATIKPYKGNRDPAHKPVHYKAIRAYLKERLGAVEVTGYEADDAVAMEAHKDPAGTIIVSVDKDLLTVPGRHYNWKIKALVTLDKETALVNFYRQLVTGDPTDNIGGAYKAGKRAAEAFILPWMDELEMYMNVLSLYSDGKEKTGCPYANMTADAALLENARLLHMLRFVGDVWEPPGTRTGPGSSEPLPEPSESSSSTSRSPSDLLSLSLATPAALVALKKLSVTSRTPLTSFSRPGGSSKPKGSSPRGTASSRSRSRNSTPPSSTVCASRETIG